MTLSINRESERNRLIQRIRKLSPESKSRWGRMTSQQAICHLSDMFRVSLGERDASRIGSRWTSRILKVLALHTPLSTPKGLSAPPEIDPHRAGTQPRDFEADREELIALIERFSEFTPDAWPDHPLFGTMRGDDWGRFHHRHLRHHLEQFGA